MMGAGGFGAMGGFGGLGMGVGLLVVIGLVVLVIWGMNALSAPRTAPGAADDEALAILRRRYARGEISQAEYEAARRALH